MPLSEHAARLIQPNRFQKDSFRQKKISEGLVLIVGKLSGKDKMIGQSYRFDRAVFTEDQAKEWLSENNVKYIAFEKAKATVQTFLSLKIQSFSKWDREKILSVIPREKLAEIQAIDKHPYFQAYVVAHEGVSNPTVLGDTAKPITWFKKAIQSIKKTVLKGVKFFLGHNEDNSTEGREALGEVVADTQEEVDGQLQHIVIGYFPDKDKVANLDVCSQEAEWDLVETANGWLADKLVKMTGIALADSNQEKPAFSGAKRVGMVQALEAVADKKETIMSLKDFSTDEIIKEIKGREVWPSSIWKFDEMLAVDGKWGPKYKETQTELETVKKDLDDKAAKIDVLTGEVKEAQRSVAKSTAGKRLDGIIKDLKLTEKQAGFVQKRFNGELEDISDEGLTTFVNDNLKIYEDALALIDGKTTMPDVNGDQEPIDQSDVTKADANELLEDDLED